MSGTEPSGGSMTTWSRLAIIGFIVGTALLAWPRSLPVATAAKQSNLITLYGWHDPCTNFAYWSPYSYEDWLALCEFTEPYCVGPGFIGMFRGGQGNLDCHPVSNKWVVPDLDENGAQVFGDFGPKGYDFLWRNCYLLEPVCEDLFDCFNDANLDGIPDYCEVIE